MARAIPCRRVARGRPHVDQVRVADAVGEQPRHADHAVAVVREDGVLGLRGRAPQGRATGRVEVGGGEVGLARAQRRRRARRRAHRHGGSLLAEPQTPSVPRSPVRLLRLRYAEARLERTAPRRPNAHLRPGLRVGLAAPRAHLHRPHAWHDPLTGTSARVGSVSTTTATTAAGGCQGAGRVMSPTPPAAVTAATMAAPSLNATSGTAGLARRRCRTRSAAGTGRAGRELGTRAAGRRRRPRDAARRGRRTAVGRHPRHTSRASRRAARSRAVHGRRGCGDDDAAVVGEHALDDALRHLEAARDGRPAPASGVEHQHRAGGARAGRERLGECPSARRRSCSSAGPGRSSATRGGADDVPARQIERAAAHRRRRVGHGAALVAGYAAPVASRASTSWTASSASAAAPARRAVRDRHRRRDRGEPLHHLLEIEAHHATVGRRRRPANWPGALPRAEEVEHDPRRRRERRGLLAGREHGEADHLRRAAR